MLVDTTDELHHYVRLFGELLEEPLFHPMHHGN